MNLNLRSGHWLNKGMDIETEKIDDDRAASVAVIGIELLPTDSGGRAPQIQYALRLIAGGHDLSSRRLDSAQVQAWLAEGKPLVREAFEWLKAQDGVSAVFMGFAAEYERAFEYGVKVDALRAKGSLRV